MPTAADFVGRYVCRKTSKCWERVIAECEWPSLTDSLANAPSASERVSSG